jgi:hypothetical protein
MNPIDEARSMFDAGEPWWPAPLLRSLEQLGHAPAAWVIRCFRVLLAAVGTSKATMLLMDLDNFERLRNSAALNELRTLGHELWYRPGRDGAQTAAARLAYALGSEGDVELTELRRALSVLVDSSATKGDKFEACVSEYRSLVAQPPANV